MLGVPLYKELRDIIYLYTAIDTLAYIPEAHQIRKNKIVAVLNTPRFIIEARYYPQRVSSYGFGVTVVSVASRVTKLIDGFRDDDGRMKWLKDYIVYDIRTRQYLYQLIISCGRELLYPYIQKIIQNVDWQISNELYEFVRNGDKYKGEIIFKDGEVMMKFE